MIIGEVLKDFSKKSLLKESFYLESLKIERRIDR